MKHNTETELNESTFIAHLPCQSCGSSDGNSLYDDGHTFCFSCNTYANPNKSIQPNQKVNMQINTTLIQGEPKALPKRNITLESSTLWKYEIAEDKGQKVQALSINDQGHCQRTVSDASKFRCGCYRIVLHARRSHCAYR